MKKKILLLIICASLLLLLLNGLNGVYSVEGPVPVKKQIKPMEVIKPENRIGIAHTEIFGELERPQVVFDHKKHTEALIKEGKKEWETCQECHPLNKDKTLVDFDFPKKVKKKDEDSYVDAYHDECMGCHKRISREKKKAGPVTCGECHVEKLAALQLKYPTFEFDFQRHDNHDKKLQEKNFKENCNLCHHVYNEELVYEKGKEWSCYYCHDLGKKRGPVLAKVMQVTEEKKLGISKVSHIRCLNCHLYYKREDRETKSTEEEKFPLECSKCHTGKYKTVAELEKVPRPDSGQEEKAFVDIENAKMKGVSFDHKTHQQNSKTCRGCHHETLNPCKDCHSLIGESDGRWVNIANAYHYSFSDKSCAGCHNVEKKDKKCAGCHHNISPMDLKTKNPKKETCARCHTGMKEGLTMPAALSVAGLDKEKVKKEVEVKVLEKEFKPSKFPHMKIIEELVKISNDSKMGTYFHAKMQTICDGCHHQSRAEAEAKKDTPPYCRNCHSITFDRQNRNRPKLIAAYHGQCMGCHDYMKLDKARKCEECHEKKAVRPAYPLEPQRSIVR